MLFVLILLLLSPIILSMIGRKVNEMDRRRAEEKALAEKLALQARKAAEQAEKDRARAAAQAEKDAEAARKRAAAQARQEAAHARKLERARELAELAERRLAAERELQALRSGSTTPGNHFKTETDKPETTSGSAQPAPEVPQSFAGEKVAFTGTLPTMTRSEAIAQTRLRGGAGYEKISTACTLLVVGQRPGETQLARAEQWNIPTITWEEWFHRAGISWRRRAAARHA